MNSQPISFPQYIDNPNQIGPFEVDDLMPFLMILWVGVFLKTKANASSLIVLIAMIGGAAASYAYIKLKRNQLRGLLQYIIHSAGIMPLNKIFKFGSGNGLNKVFWTILSCCDKWQIHIC